MSFKSLSEEINKYLEEKKLDNRFIICPESGRLCSTQVCKDECLGDSDESEEQKS
jgi:hypothetical protein